MEFSGSTVIKAPRERVFAFLIDPRAAALSNAEAIQAVAAYLGTVNLYLAAFNMIPGFPLDGGRVLRSAIWAITGDRTKATTIAARGGQVVAVRIPLAPPR